LSQKIRSAGNKARKESKEIKTKEFQEIRKENQRLRRENARLRREFEKYSNYEPPEDQTPETIKLDESIRFQCPECKSYKIINLSLGSKQITGCKECKWRQTK